MKSWNITGLYKHSRDRMPGKSRKIRATPSTAKLVPIPPQPTCEKCGFQIDTRAHKQFCGGKP